VVLARYDGDKKLSSFPYTLSLVPGQNGSIRAGAEVPVPTTSLTPAATGDKAAAMTSYTMQQVGSQVDATVTPTADGKYNLRLTVTDRSIGTAQSTQGRVPNVPSFRNMVSSSQAIISNGETIQFTASSDPASNETFRIDVTLTVGNK
jgi:type II secretory pathway component HofQ